nr:hypothetical protein GZ11A10_21 [uncultured archaeon GZfos11A10]
MNAILSDGSQTTYSLWLRNSRDRIYLNENYNINVGRKSGEIYLTIWSVGIGEAAYRN